MDSIPNKIKLYFLTAQSKGHVTLMARHYWEYYSGALSFVQITGCKSCEN